MKDAEFDFQTQPFTFGIGHYNLLVQAGCALYFYTPYSDCAITHTGHIIVQAGYVGLLTIHIPEACRDDAVTIVINPGVQPSNILNMQYSHTCDVFAPEPPPMPPLPSSARFFNPVLLVIVFAAVLGLGCTLARLIAKKTPCKHHCCISISENRIERSEGARKMYVFSCFSDEKRPSLQKFVCCDKIEVEREQQDKPTVL